VVRAGGDLSVEVIHRDRPPAFLWAILSDAAGREVARNPVFPKKNTLETLRVPVPSGLPAGRYRVVLRPEGPL
jgi:methionine-rich copper-binding protein CopC